MLREALRFPLGAPDDRGATAEALAVGWGLHLLAALLWAVPPAALLPLAVVVGYLVRVLATAGDAADPRRLPSFRSPAGLLRDGLVGSLLVAGFLLVPITLLVVTVGGALAPGAGTAAGGGGASGLGGAVDPAGPLGYGVTLLGGTATLVLAAAAVYPLPAALSAYARTDPAAGTLARARTALSLSGLRAAASSARYFYAWTVGVVLVAIGVALAGAGSRPLRRVRLLARLYLVVAAAAAWSRGVGGNR